MKLGPPIKLAAMAGLLLLAACSDKGGRTDASAARPPLPSEQAEQAKLTPLPVQTAPAPPDVTPVAQQIVSIPASTAPVALTIDQALWQARPQTPQARRDAMIRAQVLLARAHFSPGVIDGQDGANVKNAIAAFEAAHGLPVDGAMDDQVWAALSADTQPVLTDYVITADDETGPFLGKVPTDMVELAKLPAEIGRAHV